MLYPTIRFLSAWLALLPCSAILCATLTATACAVTIPTVPVGNVGNAADSTGFGSVNYEYRIGTTEVTLGQYAAFLNAVAATDTYAVYKTEMSFIGLARSGLSGSYTYSVTAGMENMPASYVSWGDAARFSNWLHNGQPAGPQNTSTTEQGAYSLNGATTDAALNAVARTAEARWWLPGRDEWSKAAYHKNDGMSANYWDYPTASDTAPIAEAAPGGNNSASYYPLQFPTETGAYVNSASPYGTFDQGGNVWEWTEGANGPSRTALGGAVGNLSGTLLSSFQGLDWSPSNYHLHIGFRVATVPEPSTYALAACGIFALAMFRRRRGSRRLSIAQTE